MCTLQTQSTKIVVRFPAALYTVVFNHNTCYNLSCLWNCLPKIYICNNKAQHRCQVTISISVCRWPEKLSIKECWDIFTNRSMSMLHH